MKPRVLIGAAILGLSASFLHAVDTKEVPIGRVGPVAVSVSVSTSAWTAINNSTSNLGQRAGYRVTNKSSNSAGMGCTCDTAAPTQAITIYDTLVPVGSGQFIPAGPGVNLYCISLNTSAENLFLREYGQ